MVLMSALQHLIRTTFTSISYILVNRVTLWSAQLFIGNKQLILKRFGFGQIIIKFNIHQAHKFNRYKILLLHRLRINSIQRFPFYSPLRNSQSRVAGACRGLRVTPCFKINCMGTSVIEEMHLGPLLADCYTN